MERQQRRFRRMEQMAGEQQTSLRQMTLADMESLWQLAKQQEKIDAEI